MHGHERSGFATYSDRYVATPLDSSDSVSAAQVLGSTEEPIRHEVEPCAIRTTETDEIGDAYSGKRGTSAAAVS